MANLDTEIRKLQPAELCTLAQVLNVQDVWKQLMAIVPEDDDENIYMFTGDHFIMIEQAARQQQRSGADVFLLEWSTIGRKRPTCRSLLDLLIKAQLFRAADYVAVDILKGSPPERPKLGPAAKIDVSDKVLEELLQQQIENLQVESPEDRSMTWSVDFLEKPALAVTAQTERTENENQTEIQSNLMKFSSVKSDLMKFSKSDECANEKSPEHLSDLMKFSAENVAKSNDKYYLEEVRTEDLPLCVREIALKPSNEILSTETENAKSATSIESSTVSEETTVSNEQIELPNISKYIIPAVVLEFNEKSKSDRA